jgi:hypothetical protein
LNGSLSAPAQIKIQRVLCLDQASSRFEQHTTLSKEGIVMRTNRRWFRIGLILLVLPLVFALYAMANGDGDRKETKYRWDITHISSFNPVTVNAGGFASALAAERA